MCCDNGWHVLRFRAIEYEGTPQATGLRSRNCGPDEDPLVSMQALKAKYISNGQSRYWYSEYQQTPQSEEGTYCKRHWYDDHRYDVAPEGLWVYMTSDFAVTKQGEGRDPDYTEHCVFGLEGVEIEETRDDKGKIVKTATAGALYVLDWWYGQETSDVWIEELLRLAHLWKPNRWFGTKGVIRNAIEPLLTRTMRERRVLVRSWIAGYSSRCTASPK